MAKKTVPYMEVNCWPLVAQSRWRARCFGISDHLANLDKSPNAGAGYNSVLGPNALPLVGASQGGHISDVDGLHWWDIYDEQDKTRLAGYSVAHRYAPMNCVVQGEAGVNPPEGVPALVWVPTSGQSEHWQTCLPDREPLATGIKYAKVDGLEKAAATTDLHLPPSQMFRVELQALGVARSTDSGLPPSLRLTWGKDLAVQFVAGRAPALVKLGGAGANGQYNTPAKALRELPYLDTFWSYGVTSFDVFYVGGRLVILAGNASTVYTARTRNANPNKAKEHDKEGKVNAIAPPAAPLQIETLGVAFDLRIHEIAHGDSEVTEEGVKTTSTAGSFRRKFYNGQRPIGADAYPVGYAPEVMKGKGTEESPTAVAEVVLDLGTGGWKGEGHYKATMKAYAHDVPQATLEGHNTPLQAVSWRNDVKTFGHGFAMRGTGSPFVHGITLKANTTWSQVETRDPVNIRPALIAASETCADPALQAGLNWNFTLSRNILPDLPHPTGIGSLGTNALTGWRAYVGKYRWIRVEVAWHYDDGVVRAYPGPNQGAQAKVSRLFGYQTGIKPMAPQFGSRMLALGARDPIFRLQKPHNLVDFRFAALDFLFADKLQRSSPDRKTALYGADGVKYILQTALGDSFADLQVYYPDWAGKWDGNYRPTSREFGQWNLYDYQLYTDPPAGGGLVFPPPFGSAPLDWIQKLCDVDFAVFFYGPDVDDRTNVAPCYGNYFSYVAGRPTTRLPDAAYLTDDENLVLHGADWEQLDSEDFNSFQVWGQAPGGGDLGGIMPALPGFSAESVGMEGSPILEQDPRVTWKRTKVLQGTQFYLPGVARQVAALARRLYFGVEVRRVGLRCRGLEWLWWGDKVYTDSDGVWSDPDMAFKRPDGNAQTFRVMRVTNDYQIAKGTWQTTLAVADQPLL